MSGENGFVGWRSLIGSGVFSISGRIAKVWRNYIPRHVGIGIFVSCLLVAFTYGFVSDRLKIFPYYQLRPISSLVERVTGTENAAARVVSGQEYSSVRSISTALLPLKLETFNLPVSVSLDETAGAICQVGNAILVLDRLGHPFRFDLANDSIKPLKWPELPNNYSAFLKSDIASFKSNFRVHDILCMKEGADYRIYVTHELFDLQNHRPRLVVSSLDVNAALTPRSSSWQRFFTSQILPGDTYSANGAGGRLAADGKGGIYLTVGDYNLDGVIHPGVAEAQNAKSDFGSIFRIDIKSGARQKISIGHRNPQGLVILSNGDVFSSEHGPKGGDELNKIKFGKNYGWLNVTYGTDYDRYSWPPSKNKGRHEGYQKPVFAWVPSIATSQLIEVTHFDERWKGDILVSSLKAGSLFRLRYEDGVVRYSEPIWIGPRIRDIIELSDNRIALWTDQAQIILISVDQAVLAYDKRDRSPVIQPGDINCMACHHIGPTNESDVAPSLSGVLNRRVASDNFAHYSPALENLGGVWTEDRLREFLLNPNDYAPGTNMVIGDMSKSQVNKAIEYLKHLD